MDRLTDGELITVREIIRLALDHFYSPDWKDEFTETTRCIDAFFDELALHRRNQALMPMQTRNSDTDLSPDTQALARQWLATIDYARERHGDDNTKFRLSAAEIRALAEAVLAKGETA